MKKAGNITSMVIMTALAAALVWSQWPSSETSRKVDFEKKPAEQSKPQQIPEQEKAQADKAAPLALSAITLPPPPAPAAAEQPAPVPKQAESKPKPVVQPALKQPAQKPAPAQDKPKRPALKPLKAAQPKPVQKVKTVQVVKTRPKIEAVAQKPRKLVPIKKTEPVKAATAETVQTLKPAAKKPAPPPDPEPRKPRFQALKPKPQIPAEESPAMQQAAETEADGPDYPEDPVSSLVENARAKVKKVSHSQTAQRDTEADWREKADKVVAVSANRNTREAQTGRTLLRLLEHGSGPGIEIAWPAGSGSRQRLFERFNSCFGMETAIMDRQGLLYQEHGPRGKAWQISMDAYSGFVRQPAGARIPREESEANRIRRYHGLSANTSLVRVFPRSVDAVILGGLSRLIGGSYKGARVIQARYDFSGSQLHIRDIRVDGRAVDGSVAVAAYRSCGGFA